MQPRQKESLLKSNAVAVRTQPQRSEAQKAADEEQEMMAAMLKKQALRSVQENATGVVFAEPIRTGWRPPTWCALYLHHRWSSAVRSLAAQASVVVRGVRICGRLR